MRLHPRYWTLLLGALAGIAMAVLAGCAGPQPAPVPTGPIPPGMARIWFYRDYDPSVSRNYANIDLNEVRAASVPPHGGPVFVDVTPGHYHISPESYGVDVNQSRDIELAAGQEVFVKILGLSSWVSGGDLSNYQRDTFYVWLIPPEVARTQIWSVR
jgi:hypothetical protein